MSSCEMRNKPYPIFISVYVLASNSEREEHIYEPLEWWAQNK